MTTTKELWTPSLPERQSLEELGTAVGNDMGLDEETVSEAIDLSGQWLSNLADLMEESPHASQQNPRELLGAAMNPGPSREDDEPAGTMKLDFRVDFAAREIFYLSFADDSATVRKLMEGHGDRIIVDFQRADEVLGVLLDAYLNRRFPYNQERVKLPHDQRHLPETMPLGGVEHAMFLWSSCYYMRGVSSRSQPCSCWQKCTMATRNCLIVRLLCGRTRKRLATC